MLTRTRLWLLGTLCLVGVSIAGYAYALSCNLWITESYDMQLISVTYDGVPQVDSPDYFQVTAWLGKGDERAFGVELRWLKDGAVIKVEDRAFCEEGFKCGF